MADPGLLTAAALAATIGAGLMGDGLVTLVGATHDSTRVSPGWLFCCVVGTRLDGHDFAADAVAAGATALLVERPLDLPVTQLVVDDVRAAMGPASAEVYGRPSDRIAVVGVTGTNGKTTTVTLAGQILEAAGHPTTVIGTLTGTRTTPEAPDLQRLLADAVEAGRTTVAMEVSSHALALHRVDGVHFAVAAFTNLGLDHLDFHETPERYFAAKARLFEAGRAAVAVLDVDDVHGRLLRDTIAVPVVEVSIDTLDDLRIEATGCHFTWRGHPVDLPLLGRHNVIDALLAAEICVALGVDPATVAAALGRVNPPAGRFEAVVAGQPFTVIVDFAHTPEALEEAIGAARDVADGRVVVVFGAGGDRDPSKRPRMGEVADRLADVVVITSDNPRSEDPSTIMAAVRRGVDRLEPLMVADRRDAIAVAVATAGPGDVVLIAGKGHETSQIIGSDELPFDDRAVAAEELAHAGWGSTPGMIRIFVAAGIALVVSSLITKLLIDWLTRLHFGQPIHEDLTGHTTKAGTPTPGGIAIVAATAISYVVSAAYRGIYTVRGLLVVGAIVGAGTVGFIDDWISVKSERNLGLGKRAKMLGLLAVAGTFAILLVTQTKQHTQLSFTRWGDIGWQLGKVGWVIWAVFLIVSASNAVNLTDGLDGLAAGSAVFAFSAFMVIGFWGFRNTPYKALASARHLYDLPQGLDLAVIAAAMVGACAGFLWWNAPPAKIFMGDTGSLAIGTGLACLALTTNTNLLLPIIGALFVAETVSVILQVFSFRVFGRRIFRMAPIHHHFELAGWAETTVTIRFWMFSAACTAAGIGLYYYDFLNTTRTLSR